MKKILLTLTTAFVGYFSYAQTNIYTSDGTLTGDRTITNGGHALNIAGSVPSLNFVASAYPTQITQLGTNNGAQGNLIFGNPGDNYIQAASSPGYGSLLFYTNSTSSIGAVPSGDLALKLSGSTVTTGSNLTVGSGTFTLPGAISFTSGVGIFPRNQYLSFEARYGSSNHGNILWNNGTSENFLLAEIGTNLYAMGGGSTGGTPTNVLVLNTSTGAVSLGTSSPNASSLLTVASTAKGSIPTPIMTTTQRNAISSPAEGLQVYDNTLHTPAYYDGSAWVISSTGGVSGTSGYMPKFTASNTIGNSAVYESSGNVLIGKTSQTNTGYILDVNGSARVNEIVVNTTGADFVFEKNYVTQA